MPITDSKDSAEKEQNPAPQNLQHEVPYPQQIEDDTIDFYELWITLWNKKWLVFAVTFIVALGSVVYALLAPQIYRAEALLLPPKAKDVQSLNIHKVQLLRVVEGVKLMQGVTAPGAFTAFKNKQERTKVKEKILIELEKANKKDQILNEREKKIISEFLQKLQKEIGSYNP